MTEPVIHDALPVSIFEPVSWTAVSGCSCGWRSDDHVDGLRSVAENAARAELKDHISSQPTIQKESTP